jgi:hypothetical protein
MKKKVLFICGSRNQTTQMHQIAQELPEVEAWFTPYYATGFEEVLRRLKLTEFTVLGHKLVTHCLEYLQDNQLRLDFAGQRNDYDLVVTCSDLVIQRNIRDTKVILVQEGITDPENSFFSVARKMRFLPRWLSGTSSSGLSDGYDYFCVASEGYQDQFICNGVKADKLRVTGIPNFDNCKEYEINDFPHHGYVLVCTSDLREKYRLENRRRLVYRALDLTRGRKLIFKLHPMENHDRAIGEISRWAPEALVYISGSAEEMIANCETFLTRYSSTVFVAMALGKEVHCDLDMELVRRLTPIQNGCAARNIAMVCREVLFQRPEETNVDLPLKDRVRVPLPRPGLLPG